MFGVDGGTIPCGFGASTTAQGLHSAPSSDQGFRYTSQIWTNQCGGKGMVMDPYPLPQHMKVVKQLSYVWSGCGNHSMWWGGFGASNTAQGNHSVPSSDPGFR